MKRVWTFVIILLATFGCAGNEVPVQVSMLQLIANPQQFHGKRIVVFGYLDLALQQREGRALYLHQEDFDHSLTTNGVALELAGADFKDEEVDHRYVVVVGTFDAHRQGHMGLWSGLVKVERMSPWPGLSRK